MLKTAVSVVGLVLLFMLCTACLATVRSAVAGTSCSDDEFEDNDTQQTATAVLLPFSEGGLRICPNDFDFFEFALLAGDTVQVDALFAHAEGDIDLVAFDAAGSFLDDSISVSDNEKMTFVAPGSGTYRVQVVLFQDFFGTAGNDYSLSISAGGQPVGGIVALPEVEDAGGRSPIGTSAIGLLAAIAVVALGGTLRWRNGRARCRRPH